MTSQVSRVLVTGGAGYVGSALVPKLLSAGYKVTVLDLYLYGRNIFANESRQYTELIEVKGDLRDPKVVEQALSGCDAVIHLACISNDPSYDLNPDLARSINFDAFQPLVQRSKALGVKKFIYASSSSVYGVKKELEVTESLSLEPLTDYSKYKARCEEVLEKEREPGFCAVTIRPSTVCGYAKRLRLDLVVNILTTHAVHNKKITVDGGDQMRPNIHIDDMVSLYVQLLDMPDDLLDGQIYNAGYQNLTVMSIAEMVKNTLDMNIEIAVKATNDNRSYHVSSDLMKKKLGFSPKHTVEDAIRDLQYAFDGGIVPDAMNSTLYYNIRRMQEINLT